MPAEVRVEFDGQDELARAARHLNAVLQATLDGGKNAMGKVGALVVKNVKRKLSQPGHGRLYRHRGVTHRASAPGEPPAVDTGKYRASWAFKTGGDLTGPYVDVGTPDKRGPWLEFGTRHMARRPHLRPAIEESRSQIITTAANEIGAKQAAAVAAMRGTKA